MDLELNNTANDQHSHRRDEFLLAMYGTMWDNINRHLTVVWQSSGILVGGTAIFALVENKSLSLDIASSIVVLVGGWAVLHAYDANSWYNRNLAIIANIERQFLNATDAKQIHYFFTRHRKPHMVDHLKIHALLGFALAILALSYHFFLQVWPGRHLPMSNFDPQRLLPYVTAAGTVVALGLFRSHYLKAHKRFETQSPGLQAEGQN